MTPVPDLDSLARELLTCRFERRHATRPSERGIELSVDQAYHIQATQLEYLSASGDKPVAIKLGLTDLAQRERAGWGAPSFGTLTDSMMIAPGGQLSVGAGLRPRVEPEIVVTLGQTLTGAPTSRAELLGLISDVRIGIEVVDPRYADDQFILVDAIADNASAHAGVIGEFSRPADFADWSLEQAELVVDGQVLSTGEGSNLMGDPLVVVEEVIRERFRLRLPVPQGLAIFTGNVAGKAIPVEPGQSVTVRATSLGEVSLVVVD